MQNFLNSGDKNSCTQFIEFDPTNELFGPSDHGRILLNINFVE